MMKPNRLPWCLLFVAFFTGAASSERATGQGVAEEFRGALLSLEQATEPKLRSLASSGFRAVAIQLRGGEQREAEQQAGERIKRSQLDLYYWIEVARCPELADAHPAWMASLQGHSEWRRLFQDAPVPGPDEVVKTYPWIPILNKEPFQAQVVRLRKLLQDRAQPTGVFLNDIQGAPSACGCGNHFCRWTTDYGDKKNATPLGNDAPAEFVNAIQSILPQSQVIPVWTTECEEHDGAKSGLCAGVGCFKGICWKAYTEQLMPVAERSPTLGVLLPYSAFGRDVERYGEPAGWIRHALQTFETMPVQHRGTAVKLNRLIAVLQGWEVTDKQVTQQVEVARRSGARGYLISYVQLEQSWKPLLVKWQP